MCSRNSPALVPLLYSVTMGLKVWQVEHLSVMHATEDSLEEWSEWYPLHGRYTVYEQRGSRNILPGRPSFIHSSSVLWKEKWDVREGYHRTGSLKLGPKGLSQASLLASSHSKPLSFIFGIYVELCCQESAISDPRGSMVRLWNHTDLHFILISAIWALHNIV